MNPSSPFILRPIATSLLMLAIFITGILSYFMIPQAPLPQVDYPTIQISTIYTGASSDVIASSITAPLESQLGQLAGLEKMYSTSSNGVSVITLRFSLDLKLDIAEQQVQAAINSAASFLPTDLPSPPIYNKVNPADTPILTLALTSDSINLTKVQDLSQTKIAQKISQINGVGLVTLSGGKKPAVRIKANPSALASLNLSLDDVKTIISNQNVKQAKGSFDGELRSSIIDANDQLLNADEYKNLIIAYRNGAPIRISDVATVVDGEENEYLSAWANKNPAIILNIQKQPNANVINTTDNIKQLLEELKTSLPSNIDLTILSDSTNTIRASIHDIQIELMLAVILVIAVIFLFLRSIAATIIAGIAVPLSLVGTFAVMYACGFTINNLTLMALAIASGFVVDDAIVMIENISRYIEAGEKPIAAAIKGAKQIGFTIISLTISLIAVLIPLIFMPDVIGRLFREFAITLAISILISAVVSLTLTPMMCSKLIKHNNIVKHNKFLNYIENLFNKLIKYYDKILSLALKHQTTVLVIAIFTLALTIVLAIIIPKGFFPQQDTGFIQVITETSQNTSFKKMSEKQQEIVNELLKNKHVESISSFVGVDGINNNLNNGRMLINLKSANHRPEITKIMEEFKNSISNISDASVYFQALQDLNVEDSLSRTQYKFTLDSTEPNLLKKWVPIIVDKLKSSPQLVDVSTDQQNNALQSYIEIDRSTASRFGVNVLNIDNALYNAFGQRLVSTIFTQSNQYKVVLEVADEFKKAPKDIEKLYVTGTIDGVSTQVPLSSIVKVIEKPTSLSINHLDRLQANTIYFNLAPNISIDDAINKIEAVQQEIKLPENVKLKFQGTSLAFKSTLSKQLLLVIAAIVTMYIVLGILYESYIHPITILSTLPSAAIGALLALILSGNDLNMISIIGIILLIGIVKKNAIMMIDFALEEERINKLTPLEAIKKACLLRLRPILMTTMAALLGALPLMLGTGIGHELRHPIGLTMVGGLCVSQILTLFTTPIIYLKFHALSEKFK